MAGWFYFLYGLVDSKLIEQKQDTKMRKPSVGSHLLPYISVLCIGMTPIKDHDGADVYRAITE